MDTRSTKVVTGEVIAVIPEYHQAVADYSGWHYSIGRKVKDFDWSILKEGDIVEMEVYTELPMVKGVLSVNKS